MAMTYSAGASNVLKGEGPTIGFAYDNLHNLCLQTNMRGANIEPWEEHKT